MLGQQCMSKQSWSRQPTHDHKFGIASALKAQMRCPAIVLSTLDSSNWHKTFWQSKHMMHVAKVRLGAAICLASHTNLLTLFLM